MRIVIINITLMQINTSLEDMIPIKWPGMWLDFKEYFEWADIDLTQLSGTTCVAGVNYYYTFAAMGAVPYIILMMALLSFLYQKCTLNYHLNHMPTSEKEKRQNDAFIDTFLLGDKDGSGTLTPQELAELLNHELHLNHYKKGKFKIDVSHALQVIRILAKDRTIMNLTLMLFIEALENDTLNQTVKKVCKLPDNHNDSGKNAMLKFIVERGLFANSFMMATHLLFIRTD